MEAQEFDLPHARARARRSNRILTVVSGGFAVMWVAFALLFLTDLRWPLLVRAGFGAVAACAAVFFGAVLPRKAVLTTRPLIGPVPDRLILDPQRLTVRMEGGGEVSKAWSERDFVLQLTEWLRSSPRFSGYTFSIGGGESIEIDRRTFDALEGAAAPWNYERYETVRKPESRVIYRRSVTYYHPGHSANSRQLLT